MISPQIAPSASWRMHVSTSAETILQSALVRPPGRCWGWLRGTNSRGARRMKLSYSSGELEFTNRGRCSHQGGAQGLPAGHDRPDPGCAAIACFDWLSFPSGRSRSFRNFGFRLAGIVDRLAGPCLIAPARPIRNEENAAEPCSRPGIAGAANAEEAECFEVSAKLATSCDGRPVISGWRLRK